MIAPIIDPDDILTAASQGESPAARFIRNPYARAAVDAYDKHRFHHPLIHNLTFYLYSFAKDRFLAGKPTHRDHLIQEAMRVGKRTASGNSRQWLLVDDFDYEKFSRDWEDAKVQGISAVEFVKSYV